MFNLGTGEGVTVMQVLEAYGRACGKRSAPEAAKVPRGGRPARCASIGSVSSGRSRLRGVHGAACSGAGGRSTTPR